jgi:AraC family transcriptional regulator
MTHGISEQTASYSVRPPGRMIVRRRPPGIVKLKVKGGLSRSQHRQAMTFLFSNIKLPITNRDIASECGLSPSYFSRAFRVTTGKPPHRWLLEYRIACAKELLFKSELTIVEIAADCGFSDQSHMTRCFTNVSGRPPGAWRRSYRE